MSSVPITAAAHRDESTGTLTVDLADSRAGEPFAAVLQTHAITQATGMARQPPDSDPDMAVVHVLTRAVAPTITQGQARSSVRAALHALSCADVVPRSRLAVLLSDPAALDAVVRAADDLAQLCAGKVPA